MPNYNCYFAKGLHQNWKKVSCKQAFCRKLLTAMAENHPQSKVTFAVFNSSFNVVGGMVSSFVIYVNAWEQTRTFLLRYKKQYCPCFQVCYGNSLLFKARLITCSCSIFLRTSKSLSSWVWSYSLWSRSHNGMSSDNHHKRFAAKASSRR